MTDKRRRLFQLRVDDMLFKQVGHYAVDQGLRPGPAAEKLIRRGLESVEKE